MRMLISAGNNLLSKSLRSLWVSIKDCENASWGWEKFSFAKVAGIVKGEHSICLLANKRKSLMRF